ncbi:type II secretion system protein GspM [Pseudomonas sp. PA15(2017)]|uniref:type II secretion system protein GspM n=1 Tax=Pseudomonas sp. PA15(2017) TaxID=1932111 RepID=UPI000969A287|nr:type II secretion system protein GspM [Pseudomonas sp. PA15(2017)]OLU28704.1 type II secretion system protein GspM [Pseudomonas sp. PA15(2017)]
MNLGFERRNVHLLAAAVIIVLLALLAWREGQQRWQVFRQWQALAQSALTMRAERTLTTDELHQAAKARDISIESLEVGNQQWLVRGRVKDERVLGDWLQQLEREGARPLRWGLRRGDSALQFDLALQR